MTASFFSISARRSSLGERTNSPQLVHHLNFEVNLSADEPTQNAASNVITKRKTWKTMKTQDELVWPPYIEAALIEGLEKYRPTGSSNPRLLRRFPKRNRWISEHILKTTGKLRTAKQVGSRLQQLRDTCKDSHVLNLLSRRDFSSFPDDQKAPSTCSTDPSPTGSFLPISLPPTCSASPSDGSQDEQRLIRSLEGPPSTREVHAPHSQYAEATNSTSSPITTPTRLTIPPPTPLMAVPTVTFTSARSISIPDHLCRFRVFFVGAEAHCDTTNLFYMSHSTTESGFSAWVYGTKFIPRFWSDLCNRADLSNCVVSQEVIRDPFSPMSEVVYGVEYDFTPTLQTPLYVPPSSSPASIWGDTSLSSSSPSSTTSALTPVSSTYIPEPTPTVVSAPSPGPGSAMPCAIAQPALEERDNDATVGLNTYGWDWTGKTQYERTGHRQDWYELDSVGRSSMRIGGAGLSDLHYTHTLEGYQYQHQEEHVQQRPQQSRLTAWTEHDGYRN